MDYIAEWTMTPSMLWGLLPWQDILKMQHSITAPKSFGEWCLQVLLQCSSGTKMFYSRSSAIASTLNATQVFITKASQCSHHCSLHQTELWIFYITPCHLYHIDFVNSGFWLIVDISIWRFCAVAIWTHSILQGTDCCQLLPWLFF